MLPLLPVLVLALSAQAPPSSPPSTDIRTTVPLVLAPASVTDRNGRQVHELAAGDFLVYDNGQLRPHQLEAFIQPISLVICIQTSGSAGPALAKMRKTGSMIIPLIAGDRGKAAVMTFSDRIRVVQDFTSSEERLARSFAALAPEGSGARMLDAVSESLRMLAPHPSDRRRVILVFGETRDRGSEAELKDMVEAAVRANVTVYALHFSTFLTPFTTRGNEKFGDEPKKGETDRRPSVMAPSGGFDVLGPLFRLGKPKAAEALARSTGGEDWSFQRLKGLEDVIARVGDDLHMQYLLSFTPAPATEAAFRQIRVEVRGRPDLTVRTRPGYWATF